jgi:opacity protein-like surface antigen
MYNGSIARYRQVTERVLRLAFAVGGLSAACQAACAADDEALSSPPPPVPLAVFGDNLPEPGRATLSLIPTFGNNSHSLIGTKGVSSQQIVTTIPWYWNPYASLLRIVPQNQFIEAQTVTLAYGVAKNFSIVLATGLIEKHSDLMTFYGSSNLIPRGMSFPGTDSLQDTSASIIWRAYQDHIHRIKVNLGMSFPTGSTYNQGGAVLQTTGTYNITRAFYGMQSGTGTFDALPGVMYAGTIAPWSWGFSYRARLPLGVNNEGYMWGNYQEVNAWGGYTWLPGLTTTIRANFNIQSPINGKDYWMTGKLQSANPNFYGGKRVEMFAGVDIEGKLFGAPGFSIGVEAGVPVYQNLNGPQLSKNWQAGMALRWRVGEPDASSTAAVSKAFSGPSVAAAPEPLAPWAGVYFGANGGYTWADDTNTNFTYAGSGGFVSLWRAGALPSHINLNSNGFLGGAQVGYNYQLHEEAIAGFEADLQGLAVGNSTVSSWQGPSTAYTFVQAQRNQHSLGTVRSRLGYLVTPTALIYGTGGLAFGEAILNPTYFSPQLTPVLNFGVGLNGLTGYVDMRLGWAAGAGVEWIFAPRWSGKVEYLHYDLGVANTANVGALYYGSSSAAYSAPFNGNVVRAGVNYHLN